MNKGIIFVKENTSSAIAKAILNQFPDTSLKDLTNLIDRYKKIDSWYDSTKIIKSDYDRLIDIMLYGKTINNKLDTEILFTNEFNE